MPARKLTIGLIPANRAFFSDKLAAKMRAATIKAIKAAGADVVVPDTVMTKVGCVETLEEAEKVGKMFREADVDGIVVGAMNFGDEQGVAYTIRHAGLDVPILLFGCQEEGPLTPKRDRRDSFCGLLSIAEALRQIDVPYTVAQRPICLPSDPSFKQDLGWFLGVCRVVGGLRTARYGQIGTRPDPFWTCRVDEVQLQRLGVTTVTMDFSEVVRSVKGMRKDAAVKRILADMQQGIDTSAVPEERLVQMAKFERVLERFAEDANLDGLAVQCWINIQDDLEICSCGVMGRLGDRGLPCACEVDVLGAMTMHAMLLAGESPAALADWNNLHHQDPELVNLWHCGVFPASFAGTKAKMGPQTILATVRDPEVCMGCVEFEMRPGPVTVARIAQSEEGGWKSVVAEGKVERTKEKTFGAYGWTRLKNLPTLYRDVLLQHFPHHAGLARGLCGNILYEAWGHYLGFDIYTNTDQVVPGRYETRMPF